MIRLPPYACTKIDFEAGFMWILMYLYLYKRTIKIFALFMPYVEYSGDVRYESMHVI